jgi:hypothetical protein
VDGGYPAMTRIGIYIPLVLLLVCFGCEKSIERPMVIGKYRANHQKGIDSLELKPDGNYTYNYKALDGKEIENSNRWEFEYSNDRSTITFHSFVFGLPGYGSKQAGFWVVEVKRSFAGNLRLYIDTDLGYYYEKIK